MRPRPLTSLIAALSVALAAATTGCSLNSPTNNAKPGSLAKNASLKGVTLTVGSKEFTEQLVLCQLTALALRSAGATVNEKCGLQGSNTTRTALTSGSIDMYWEYTGTAWINYLKHTKPVSDPGEQYRSVAQEDLSSNKIKWLDPAPANNTYAIVAKTTTAQKLGVASLSDYSKLMKSDPAQASMCVASEFAGRSDGLPGLEQRYGFKVPKDHLASLAEGAIYDAVAKGRPCNFAEAATTDGRIQALKLTVLEDDKHFFPIYNPAPTIRASVYEAHPDIAKVLNPIASELNDSTLQQLNGAVDIDGQEPSDVARKWLESKGYVGK